MKIGLLLIATNKYVQFLQPLIDSADEHFLKDEDVTYFIYTNQPINIKTKRKIQTFDVNHIDWPGMTLFRYELFDKSSPFLSKMDHLYYCDADMRFIDSVDKEIISDRVVTIHPGFLGKRGTPEYRSESLAYVKPEEEMTYFAGGFNGGSSSEFLKMSKILSERIQNDLSRKVVAIWHDESHLNRYMIDNKPTLILDPGYCYPESWKLDYHKRLLALDKNHSEIRS